MTAVKESVFFASDSCLSYHSTSSPVTYQPQRTRLLSNVFGGLFLCVLVALSGILFLIMTGILYIIYTVLYLLSLTLMTLH